MALGGLEFTPKIIRYILYDGQGCTSISATKYFYDLIYGSLSYEPYKKYVCLAGVGARR